jgi:hypothetical protein
MSTKECCPTTNENFLYFNNSPYPALPPLDWNMKIDLLELQDYFTNIRKSQVILKPFEVESESDLGLVKEVYQRRVKVIGYLQLLCASYGFRNETLFKSLQLFDMYFYKIVSKVLRAKKIMRGERGQRGDKEYEIEHTLMKPAQEEFSEFFDNLIVYAVLCLSLACKLEEVNCNYLAFFNDNLLKSKFNFSVNYLNLKETNLLMKFNFKLSMPCSLQFSNTFVQLAIHEIFSCQGEAEGGFNSLLCPPEQVVKLLLQINEEFLKSYSQLPESIFNSPLTSALICFKASLLYLSQEFKIEIFSIQERLNKFVFSQVKNFEYIQKIDAEAFKVCTRVGKLENEKGGKSSNSNKKIISNMFYVKSNQSVTTFSQ